MIFCLRPRSYFYAEGYNFIAIVGRPHRFFTGFRVDFLEVLIDRLHLVSLNSSNVTLGVVRVDSATSSEDAGRGSFWLYACGPSRRIDIDLSGHFFVCLFNHLGPLALGLWIKAYLRAIHNARHRNAQQGFSRYDTLTNLSQIREAVKSSL